jgi:hypothetical protein
MSQFGASRLRPTRYFLSDLLGPVWIHREFVTAAPQIHAHDERQRIIPLEHASSGIGMRVLAFFVTGCSTAIRSDRSTSIRDIQSLATNVRSHRTVSCDHHSTNVRYSPSIVQSRQSASVKQRSFPAARRMGQIDPNRTVVRRPDSGVFRL